LTVYSVEGGRVLANEFVPSEPIVAPDAAMLLTCSGSGIEVRDARTLAVRRTLPVACALPFYGRVSPDGRLLTLSTDQRVVRLTDGASLTLSTAIDELGAHHVAYAPSGAFWAYAEDLPYLAVERGGQAIGDASRFVAPTLLRDFFAGRPLPEPGGRAPHAPRVPYPVTPERNQRILARNVIVRWAPDLAGAQGRICRDPECRTVIVSGLRNYSSLPEGPSWPAVAYLSVVSAGRASPALRFEIDPPIDGALSPEPMLELTQPTSEEIRIRFRSDGPTWRAQAFACDGPIEPIEYDEPGCGALRLTSDAGTRVMTIDLDRRSWSLWLRAIGRPDGSRALLLVEQRSVPGQATEWTLHLLEDDGRGPHLVLRTGFPVPCEEEPCPDVVHPRARYADVDRDGALDFVLGVSSLTIDFVRRGERFAPSTDELYSEFTPFGLIQ
jgi:hypothetical protein